jgi:hypothetical protein
VHKSWDATIGWQRISKIKDAINYEGNHPKRLAHHMPITPPGKRHCVIHRTLHRSMSGGWLRSLLSQACLTSFCVIYPDIICSDDETGNDIDQSNPGNAAVRPMDFTTSQIRTFLAYLLTYLLPPLPLPLLMLPSDTT